MVLGTILVKKIAKVTCYLAEVDQVCLLSENCSLCPEGDFLRMTDLLTVELKQ